MIDISEQRLVELITKLDNRVGYLQRLDIEKIIATVAAPRFICRGVSGEHAPIRLLSVSEFIRINKEAGLYPDSERDARKLIHHAGENGLQASGAVIKDRKKEGVKGRTSIDADKFYAWLYKNGFPRKEPSDGGKA